MATPNIHLEVITDLLLKVGKIDDKEVIAKLQKAVKTIPVPTVSFDALLDVKDTGRAGRALDGLRSKSEKLQGTYDNLGSTIDKAFNRLRDDKTGIGSKAFDELFPDQEDLKQRAIKAAQAQIGTYQQFYRNLEKAVTLPFPDKKIGKTLQESDAILRGIAKKHGDISGYGKQEVAAARELNDYTRQRLRLLKQARQQAITLFPKYFEAKEVAIRDEGGEVIGKDTRQVAKPGAPVFISGLDKAIDQAERAQKKFDNIFSTPNADEFNKKLAEVKKSLGKSGVEGEVKKLQAELSKLSLDDTARNRLNRQLEKLQKSYEADRKALEKISKSDVDNKVRQAGAETLHRKDLQRAEKLADYRLAAENEVAKHREKLLARYLKGVKSVAYTPFAQAEAAIGERFLKGQTVRPDVVIPKIDDRRVAGDVEQALAQRVAKSVEAIHKYTRGVDAASLATDKTFLKMRDNLYQNYELLNAAQKQVKEIERRTTRTYKEQQEKKRVANLKAEAKATKEIAEARAKAREIASGQAVLRRYGAVENIQTIGEMQRALASLEEQQRKVTKANDDYRQSADFDPVSKKYEGLANQATKTAAEVDKATRRLNDMVKVDPKALSDRVTKVTDDVSRLNDSATKALTSLRSGLRVRGKDLPTDQFEKLEKSADGFAKKLQDIADLRDKASRETDDNKRLQQLDELSRRTKDLTSDIKSQTAALGLQREEALRGPRPGTVTGEGVRPRVYSDRLADLGEREIERRARDSGLDLERDARGRVSGAGLAAAIGAGQAFDADQQLAVASALERRLSQGAAEEARVLRALEAGDKQAHADAERVGKSIKGVKEGIDTLSKRPEVDSDIRDRVAAEGKAEAKAAKDFSAAQRAYARKEYGVDLDDLRAMNDFIDKSQLRMTDRRGELVRRMKLLADGGRQGGEAFQYAQKQLAALEGKMRDLGPVSKQVKSQLAAISYASDPEKLTQLQLARRQLASSAIERSGGEKGLAKTLGGVSASDKQLLPLIRDELRERLSAQRGLQDTLTAQGKGASAEFKESARAAAVLEKGVARVNTQLKGYYTLTAQIGGLFRQFARYGLGYAALYQVLFGVRALVGGVVDLDTALTSIKAVTASTDQEMATIEKTIKRVAVTTQFTTNEIAKAAQILAQAGVEANEFPKTLTAVAAFASATQSAMEISADLISTVRNVYNELDDLDIANQLTRAVNISKLTAEDLKTILSLSAQMGKAYNLASEQYLSAVSTLRNAGIKASTVATGLRQSLIEIFSPDTKTIKVLTKRYRELGEERDESDIRKRFYSFTQAGDPVLAVLRELRRLGFAGSAKGTFSGRTFDVRAENAINGLITRLDEYVQSQAQIVFGNAAITASQTQMEALSNNLKNLGAALTSVSHDMSADLIPEITRFVKTLTEAVDAVGEFDAYLRVTSGGGVGNAIQGGILGGILGLAGQSKGSSALAKTAAVVGGAAFGGAAASGAQVIAGKLGASDVEGEYVAEATLGAAGLLLFFKNWVLDKIKQIFSKDLWKKILSPSEPKQGDLFEDAEKQARKSQGIVKRGVNLLKKFAGAIYGLFMALSPTGKVIAAVLAATGAATAYFRSQEDSSDDIQGRIKTAEKASEAARGKYETIKQTLNAYRKSDPLTGYEAPDSSIAGVIEDLKQDLDDYNALVDSIFGDINEKKRKEITQQIQDIEKFTPEEGPGRIRRVSKLEGVVEGGVDFSSDNDARDRLQNLVALRARIDNTNKGFFDNSKKLYEKFEQEQTSLQETTEGHLSRAFDQGIKSAGVQQEIAGYAEIVAEKSVMFGTAVLDTFAESSDAIGELTEAQEEYTRKLKIHLGLVLQDIQNAALTSPDKARRIAANAVRVPRSPEEYRELQERVGLVSSRPEEINTAIQETLAKPNVVERVHPIYGIVTKEQVSYREELERLRVEFEAVNNFLEVARKALGVYNKKIQDDIVDSATRQADVVNKLIQLQQYVDEGRPGARVQLENVLSIPRFKTLAGSVNADLAAGQTPEEIAAKYISEKEEDGVPKKVVDDTFKDLGVQLGTGLDKVRQFKPQPLQLFENTQEFLDLRKALSDARVEVAKFKNAKNFEDLQKALVILRDTELALADANIRFLKNQGPGKDATESQRVAHERKILDEQERRRQIDERFEAEKARFKQQELSLIQRRTKAQIDAFKKVAGDAADSPFSSAFSDALQSEEEFQAIVEKHVEALRERLISEKVSKEEIDLQIEAFRTTHRSLYEFADVIAKAIKATEEYIDANRALTSASSLSPGSDLDLEVDRRDKGIRPSPEARYKDIRRDVALERAKFDQAIKDYAAIDQEINDSLAESRAEAAAGNQDKADRLLKTAQGLYRNELPQVQEQLQESTEALAELREETRKVSLDIYGELEQAFAIEGILSDLTKNVEDTIGNISNEIRDSLNQAFDDVASTMVDTLFGDIEQSFADAMRDLVKDTLKDITRTVLEATFKKALIGGFKAVLPESITKLIDNKGAGATNPFEKLFAKGIKAKEVNITAKEVVIKKAVADAADKVSKEMETELPKLETTRFDECDPCLRELLFALTDGTRTPAAEGLPGAGAGESENTDKSRLEATDRAIDAILQADLRRVEREEKEREAKKRAETTEASPYDITGPYNPEEKSLEQALSDGLTIEKVDVQAQEFKVDANAAEAYVNLDAGTLSLSAGGSGGVGTAVKGETSTEFNAIGKISNAINSVLAPVGEYLGNSGLTIQSSASNLFSSLGNLFARTGGVISAPLRRAGGGLLDRLRGSDKGGAVRRNFESEKAEQREMLGEALEDKLQEEGILKRGMGGMVRIMRRGRGGSVDDMSLGDAIRRTHGGVVRGPGTGTSDSIPGVIVDSSGRPQRGIAVSNGEAILNQKATAKLGKPTIDWINTHADKLASGGIVGGGPSKMSEVVRNMTQQRTRTRDSGTAEIGGLKAALEQIHEAVSRPTDMRLDVSDSALNRTLREHIEGYLGDVVAGR